ncbi:MAG: 50S ribosomal protein L10 [Bdellovibrionales bacterium]|nr:50S ribosomal protein L10 [Bdellovibrionales bacterium]
MSGHNRAIKETVVADLTKQLSSVQAAVVTHCTGVTVEKMTELREKLRKGNSQIKVIKNTIATRAIEGTELDVLKDHFKGPTALAYTSDDPVAMAKLIMTFAEQNESFSIKAGVLNGDLLDETKVKSLASTPSREVLLARLAGSLQAPYAGLVYSLSGILRKLVYALDAVRRKKEEEQGS